MTYNLPQVQINTFEAPNAMEIVAKRDWIRIQQEESLLLEATSSFGLPAYFAGKVLLHKSRNAARMIRKLNENRALIRQSQEPAERLTTDLRIKQEKRGAKLEALIQISKIREQGLIKARNLIKMDKKVNKTTLKAVRHILAVNSNKTLPEMVAEHSRGIRRLRQLPMVCTSQLGEQQNRLPPFRPAGSLRLDINDEEKRRMHKFLFKQDYESQLKETSVKPVSLSHEMY